jgi:hypothetical protein
MTEFGAAKSAALIDKVVKGRIYRLSGADALAAGAATALAPNSCARGANRGNLRI